MDVSKISKVTMSGVADDLSEIYPKLLEIKKKLFYCGYSLADAPYHGWTGEPLRNIRFVVDKQEDLIDECVSICQAALGLTIDADAWKNQ